MAEKVAERIAGAVAVVPTADWIGLDRGYLDERRSSLSLSSGAAAALASEVSV